MKDKIIGEVTRQMLPYLDNFQLEKLQEALSYCLRGVQIECEAENLFRDFPEKTSEELLSMFISAKRVEGCSEKTIKYYRTTLSKLISTINLHVTRIKTEDIRDYLSSYQ